MKTKWEVWLITNKGEWLKVEESNEDFLEMNSKFNDWKTRDRSTYPNSEVVLVQVDRTILK